MHYLAWSFTKIHGVYELLAVQFKSKNRKFEPERLFRKENEKAIGFILNPKLTAKVWGAQIYNLICNMIELFSIW